MPNGYTHDKNPDKELFELLKKDLDTNFWLLVQKYSGLCRSRAMVLTHDTQDAEDVTQAAFIGAYKGLKTFIKKGLVVDNLKAWMLKIVLNEYINFSNAKQRKLQVGPITESHEQLLENSSSERPENVVETTELQERIARTIDRLPKIYQEMFCLYYIEGLTSQEIHQEVYPDMSINTIKGRIRRAKELFRIIWENDPDEEGK